MAPCVIGRYLSPVDDWRTRRRVKEVVRCRQMYSLSHGGIKDEGTSSTTLQIVGKCVSLTLLADKGGQLENIMSHRQRCFLSHGGLTDNGAK